MPPIKIQHVVSFSSEDKVYKAENLLKHDTYRKWKCGTPGEKQASVVLQLEKATQIQSIDIGNEGSAFIEVLVARSSDTKEDYQVLLVASSFMTPIESRQNTNLNKVRMFGQENLSQSSSNEKWDRVKIVCTQPFNKNIQYGISFITLNSQPNSSDVTSPKTCTQETILGHFKLKDDDEDKVKVGSWFAKHQEKKSDEPLTGPASIRLASNSVDSSQSTSKEKLEKSKASLLKYLEMKNTSINNSNEELAPKKKAFPTESKRKIDATEIPNKRQKANTPAFDKLMKDIVFVISGFQNPLRSEIRDKALDMGAKYKADWDVTCTHLVCAFVNTPKYQQVMAKGGKIVKKDWILDCHKKKSLLPWKRYRLGKSNDNESTSESEPDIPPKNHSPQVKTKAQSQTENSRKDKSREPIKPSASGDDIFDADTDVDSDSGCDTEDELKKFRTSHSKPSRTDDAESAPTHKNTRNLPLPSLPDIYRGRHFFLYGKSVMNHRHALQRYILGCLGVIEDYMSGNVDYVITNEKWNKDFDDALTENGNVKFVKPAWIMKCVEKNEFLHYEDYDITNTASSH